MSSSKLWEDVDPVHHQDQNSVQGEWDWFGWYDDWYSYGGIHDWYSDWHNCWYAWDIRVQFCVMLCCRSAKSMVIKSSRQAVVVRDDSVLYRSLVFEPSVTCDFFDILLRRKALQLHMIHCFEYRYSYQCDPRTECVFYMFMCFVHSVPLIPSVDLSHVLTCHLMMCSHLFGFRQRERAG